jgi:hypothetical protein
LLTNLLVNSTDPRDLGGLVLKPTFLEAMDPLLSTDLQAFLEKVDPRNVSELWVMLDLEWRGLHHGCPAPQEWGDLLFDLLAPQVTLDLQQWVFDLLAPQVTSDLQQWGDLFDLLAPQVTSDLQQWGDLLFDHLVQVTSDLQQWEDLLFDLLAPQVTSDLQQWEDLLFDHLAPLEWEELSHLAPLEWEELSRLAFPDPRNPPVMLAHHYLAPLVTPDPH